MQRHIPVRRTANQEKKTTLKKNPQANGKSKSADGKTEEKKPPKRLVRVIRNSLDNVPVPRSRKTPIPNYRVSIRLKNGRRFSGIVSRDIRFHRHMQARDHLTPSVYAKAEPFTLRYVDGMDGEIQMNWKDMKRLDVRQVVDTAGMLAMEKSVFHDRLNRREQLANKLLERRMATGKGPGESVGQADAGTPSTMPELLSRFPEEKGWGPDRREQILWRKSVIGVSPDEDEQVFLDSFDQWVTLNTEWQDKAPPVTTKAKKEATPEPSSGEGAKDGDGDDADSSTGDTDTAKPATGKKPSKRAKPTPGRTGPGSYGMAASRS